MKTEKIDGNCFEVAGSIALQALAYVRGDGLAPVSLDEAENAWAAMQGLGFDIEHEFSELNVIHANVTRSTDGLRHCHAWVEFFVPKIGRTLALDFANGHHYIGDAAEYRGCGEVTTEPEEYAEYDYMRACSEMLDSEHYGPWENFS